MGFGVVMAALQSPESDFMSASAGARVRDESRVMSMAMVLLCGRRMNATLRCGLERYLLEDCGPETAGCQRYR